MEELGKVIEVTGDKAKVSLKRNAVCARCGACFAASSNEMIAEAKNMVGAKVGEIVRISLEEEKILSASFIVYGFPLIFFVLGYLAGSYLSKFFGLLKASEGLGILSAFIFLSISFYLISLRFGKGKEQAEKFIPIIKEIVRSGEREIN